MRAVCAVFYKFLVTNGVLFQYRQYVTNSKMNNYKIMDGFLMDYAPEEFLGYAFTWKETKEGYAFWDLLNQKWCTQQGYVNKFGTSTL